MIGMDPLFRISTDRAVLEWCGPRNPHRLQVKSTPYGLLKVSTRPGTNVTVYRPTLGDHVTGPEVMDGPCLFEETPYHVAISSPSQSVVSIRHRDKDIEAAFVPAPSRKDVVTGLVNFRSQVGLTEFEVQVDGVTEFSFEVEIFPRKLDYKTDYEEMLAEVTNFLTALALDYLRATYRGGRAVKVPEPYDVEWLTLLKHVLNDLEQALQRINNRPRRCLHREEQLVRPDRVRKVDSTVRRAVTRGQGRGQAQPTAWGYVRSQIPQLHAVETLDTPEHRWLRAQLNDIRSHLAMLAKAEQARTTRLSQKQKKTLEEITYMQSRIALLLKLEPITAAVGSPPAGFSSLVLQSADGYRQAYTACLTLRLGLRMEGGLLQLSTKDIAMLYEYWCYLALVQLVGQELGAAVDPHELFRVTSKGLWVDLERGRTKQIQLMNKSSANPTAVTLSYNPSYKTDTGTQTPDVGFSLKVEGWETPFELILDAKYRIDASDDYIKQHNTPGPPVDAVNAMHRYRDAILSANEPKDRRIMIGVALFPGNDATGQFTNNTFYKSLERVGIGALPFLPGQKGYVADWLRKVFRQSGWLLADQVHDHVLLRERARRMAAAQAALVLPVSDGYDGLTKLMHEHRVRIPLRRLGPRRLAVEWLAFYLPGNGTQPGAITHEARVTGIQVVCSVDAASEQPVPSEPVIEYTWEALDERPQPLIAPSGVGAFRWSTRLSLDKAQQPHELYLETEPEWALYEALHQLGVPVELEPLKATAMALADSQGLVEIKAADWYVRYEGAAAFRLRHNIAKRYCGSVTAVLQTMGLW
jgi:predicted component of viral defense system (DUF524 family)